MDEKYLIVILVLAVLFGASRLPSLARGVGRGIRELKQGLAESPPDDPGVAAAVPPDDDRGSVS